MVTQEFIYPPASSSSTAGGATAANQVLEIADLDAINTSTSAINGKLPSGLTVTSTRLLVDGSGVTQPVSAASLPLPSGAATSANQATEIASLASIDTKLTSPLTVTGPLTDTQLRASAVPVSMAAVPTGGATAANQATEIASLASIDSKLTSPLTVTGPLTDTQLRATAVPVSGTVTANAGSGTFAVSAASLPLPSGAATESTLSTLNGKVTACNTGAVVVSSSALPSGASTAVKQPALGTAGTASADVITVQGIASMTALKVDGSAVTQPISAASLPLPSGAATSALQSTISGQLPTTLGTKTSANSLAVVLASDQANVNVALGGRAKANAPTLNDYSSVNVTSAAYVQMIASTTSTANMIEIFDSSGQTIKLAVGAAASEVDQFIIIPGGNGQVPLAIPSGSRISVKATGTSATTGILVINLYT